MADLAGESLLGPFAVLTANNQTPDLTHSYGPIRGLAMSEFLAGDPIAADYTALVSSEPGRAIGGNMLGCFEELFNKIIISPRKKACGFVMADVVWQTNCWNTHRDDFRELTRCDVADSGNVSVNNPLGYPLIIAPLHSFDLETIVPQYGDVTIRAILTFVVTGETGTDVLVTGSRITIFPFEPDWTDPVKERTQYLTDILRGYTAKEQRIKLRHNPRVHLSFRAMPTDRQESAFLEALLYGWQARTFGVPFWPDAVKIAQTAAAGAAVIHCDTSNRKFAAAGIVVLWRDCFTYEAASIASVDGESITTTAPLNKTWQADGRTYAIPALSAKWDGDALLSRLGSSHQETDIAFQCDPHPDVPEASPTQAYGHDVMEVVPNEDSSRAMQYTRTLKVLDCSTGKSKAIDRSGVAIGQPSGFLWTLEGRTEIAAYRAWLSRRSGQWSSFWLPTWRHDLVQHLDLAAAAVNLVIKNTGYTRHQYPHSARRYLCITMLDGSNQRFYRRIMGAIESGNTETITLDSALSAGSVIAVGSCMISFMNLVRLDIDEPVLIWHTRDLAEVQLDCVEVPAEVLQ